MRLEFECNNHVDNDLIMIWKYTFKNDKVEFFRPSSANTKLKNIFKKRTRNLMIILSGRLLKTSGEKRFDVVSCISQWNRNELIEPEGRK